MPYCRAVGPSVCFGLGWMYGLTSSKVGWFRKAREQLATKNFAQSVLKVGPVVSIGDGIAPSIGGVKHASGVPKLVR
jgi:hypothetical protein